MDSTIPALFPLLFEMPITRFQTVGDLSKPGQFDKTDRAILQSEKAVEKIHRQFGKTGIDFNFYLFHKVPSELKQYQGRGKQISFDDLWAIPSLDKETIQQIINESSDAITIFYLGNTAADKHMFNGWVIAHRFGHALSSIWSWKTFEKYIEELFLDTILNQVFRQGKFDRISILLIDNPRNVNLVKRIMSAMGTMKSARESNLRTPYEFLYELFAQYLITGKVKLNPIPKGLLSHYTWGNPHYHTAQDIEALEFLNSLLPQKENDIESLLDDVLGEAIGSVFVI